MTHLFDRRFEVDTLPPIEVYIYEPVEQHDQTWTCKHKMLWHDGIEEYDTTGGDKLQALLLCLSRIESQLIAESNRLGRKITYLGDDRMGLIWDDWQRSIT